jgi:UTP--glucose-1-phosphate uridylyltransferase
MVRKAVVLAAGYGTRFLPTTKAVPKELLPLYDRPAIHYIVEECAHSGIEEVILVVSRGKHAVADYFQPSLWLENVLHEKGDHERLAQLQEVSRLATVTAVEQKEMRGTGDAVLAAEEAVGGEPFLAVYPDDVIIADPPVASQVIEVFRDKQAPICAVEEVQEGEVSNYGIADGEMVEERLLRVERLVEKPQPSDVRSRMALFGRYVLTPEIFDVIRETPPGRQGEVWLTDAVSTLASRREVYAYAFRGKRYDTGRPLTMLKGAIDIALSRLDAAPELEAYLRERLGRGERPRSSG